jgi:hypothetical protein
LSRSSRPRAGRVTYPPFPNATLTWSKYVSTPVPSEDPSSDFSREAQS